MICIVCLEDRKPDDFFKKNGGLKCYKCIYNEKIGRKLTERFCKVCNKKLPSNKWAYCKAECAHIAKFKQLSEYWTNRI